MTTNIKLRKALPSDAETILELIKELAIYEKEPDAVTNTARDITEDGFGSNPAFECLLAEVNGEVAGLSLWYTRYSTWKGKMLYLEDIIVREHLRGQGIGKALFDATIRRAKELGHKGMIWQVLDWNEPAIRFYKKYEANFDGEWVNVKLTEDQIQSYL